MAVTIYEQKNYNCELASIDVYFEYRNSVVFCTGEKTISQKGIESFSCARLTVVSKCTVEQYQGSSEVTRYFRGDNLVIQGIITFFTGIPLTVYHCDGGSVGLQSIEYKKQQTHLSMEGSDYTEDLQILLKKLEEEPELIITSLDRWRKAIYLKEESYEADLYYDEVTLSFFHILELFGDTVNKELRAKLENNIEKMLQQHYENFYFDDMKVKQMVEQNKKAVNTLLIGDFLNLAVKVKYFLEKYDLLDDNVDEFIDNMIKVRNAVAHGRMTHQKMFIWPLSPFFNLAKDSYNNIEFMYFLTATMISKYVGMQCWQEEWNETKKLLMPPRRMIRAFLKGELTVEKDSLVDGREYNISWRALFHYYVKNPKKETRRELESAIEDMFINTSVNEENAPDIFNMSIILADSEKKEIKEKAIENVGIIIKEDWYGWSHVRDAYIYLQFYFVEAEWYKNFLDNKEYLRLKGLNKAGAEKG